MTSIKEKHDNMNYKIYSRNIPSQYLQQYIDVRPVQTKYSFFPIIDPRTPPTVQYKECKPYNVKTEFNPGNTISPWSGFNANVESELRNQIFAYQKCSKATWVPSSTSDLYNYNFEPTQKNNLNSETHSLLFEKPTFCEFNPNVKNSKCGSLLFMNNTRCQLKELS